MTKSDDKKVPALRFKGFTDDWEQRKLGDVLFKFDYGLNSASSDYDGKNKYLRITDIDEQTHRFNLDNLTSPKVDLKNKDNYILHPGDIVFARTGASVGKTYKYREDDGRVYFAGFLIRGRINKNFDTSFIFDTTLLPKYSNFVKITSIRSGQPGINSDEYKKYVINIPTINEQKYISKLITNLEELITLQQRKLTELQLLRTSLNQQLLKDNSSWKSVKLREILNIRNKQIFPNQQYPLMSFVQKQGVVPKSQRYNRDFLVKGNKKYKVTEKGDFIYSSNNLETGSIGINKTGNATISPVYSVFSSKNYKESLFIGLLSEKKSFIYKMIRFRQGVVYGQWKIPEKDFLNIKIKIPNYQEQEKIITLFTHIDNQFKQENKKLTDLQNFKQFLLQNMFI